MARSKNKLLIGADTRELCALLDELSSELPNVSGEVREFLFSFRDVPHELLVTTEFVITSRTAATLFFKPSNLLLDLAVAIRTCDFNNLLVEYPHGFSFAGDRLVELPSLSALERPPNQDRKGELDD